MFEVTFSDQSMAMLNRLDITVQMPIIERFSSLSHTDLKNGGDELGKFERGGKTYYRLRAGDFRIYFEILPGNHLISHYILHKHTMADFIFRFKLPYREETLIEQNQSFWQYVESLTRQTATDKLEHEQNHHQETPGRFPGA